MYQETKINTQVSSDSDNPIHKKPVKAMPPEQPSNHPVILTATDQPTLSKPTKQLGRTSQSASSTAINQPSNSKSTKKRQNKKSQNTKDSNCFLESKVKQNISNTCNEVCFYLLFKDYPTMLAKSLYLKGMLKKIWKEKPSHMVQTKIIFYKTLLL